MAIDRRLIKEAQEVDKEVARRKAAKRLHDPVDFARSCGIDPDENQQKILRFDGDSLLLNCARQFGKSTIAAVFGLHRALIKPGSLVLVISPSQRQSTELLIKVKVAMRNMVVSPQLDKDNSLSIEFQNDSRIISLPANEGTIRGFSAVDVLIEDEAGDVPDELNVAIRPMLAVSGGQLLLMGTPRGRRGHFFETWEHGGAEWTKHKVIAEDIPRYKPGFLAMEREDMFRRGMGEYYRQEYECEFVNAAAGRVYGGYDDHRNGIDEPPRGHAEWTYLLGLDFGIKDANAVTVLGWRSNDPCVYIIESYHFDGIPSEVAEEVQRLDRKYQFTRIVGDVGGMGKAFAEEARRRFHLPIEPAEKHNKVGFISLFNGDMHTGRIKVVRSMCRKLISEWNELPWAEGGKKEADGFDNHCADSALYSWRATNAFLENTRRVIMPGSREWLKQEQEEMLANDLEKIERERSEEWWQSN